MRGWYGPKQRFTVSYLGPLKDTTSFKNGQHSFQRLLVVLIYLSTSVIAFSALIFLLVMTAQPSRGQATVDAAMVANPSQVTVGDIFTLTLQVIHPAGAQIAPAPFESQWGVFEIRQIEPLATTTLEGGNEEQSIQVLRATLWATGTFTTPEYEISVVDADGMATQHSVQSATVNVKSVLQPGDETLRDIKPQASLAFIPRWVQILAALIIAAMVLGAIIWLWQRRRNVPEDTASEPIFVDTRPADVKALEALHEIAERHLPTQRLFAEHYDLVTDVVRRYLHEGFGIPALDQTTSELNLTFPSNVLDVDDRALLFQLLEEADLVKFAKVEPDFGQADQLPERARQFVLATAVRLREPKAKPDVEVNHGHPSPHLSYPQQEGQGE